MEPGKNLILVALCLFTLFVAGCITEDVQPPAVVSPPQPGADLKVIGDVIGHGIILQGVPRGTIDTITFSVGLASGAKSISLDNLTVVYADAVRTETLAPMTGVRTDTPSPGSWSIVQVDNEKGNRNDRLEFDEQAVIRINPRAPIVPNQVITISVKPAEAGPLISRWVAPASILPGDNILMAL
jgi:flagellin FlaB